MKNTVLNTSIAIKFTSKNLFNKLVILVLSITLITAVSCKKTVQSPRKVIFWIMGGTAPESFKVSIDSSTFQNGSYSACLESVTKNPKGFGTIQQQFNAKDYAGKRLKMSAYIKTQNVKLGTAFWINIANDSFTVAFDNMSQGKIDRTIYGTNEWAKHDIIIDVPINSEIINFGVFLDGVGKIWIDNFTFSIVDEKTTEITGKENETWLHKKNPSENSLNNDMRVPLIKTKNGPFNTQPFNIDFEE